MWTMTRSYNDPRIQAIAKWVCRVMNAAEPTAKMIGCSPEAIVAQAALESGWGRAAIGNNLFGIKATADWKGAVLVRRTAEQTPGGEVYYVEAAFRDYPSEADSIADHFAFLKRNRRYTDAGVFAAKSDHEYFAALKRAGYATDVDYVAKLDGVLAMVTAYVKDMSRDGRIPAPAAPRLLMIGDRGGDVSEVQQALSAAGFYPAVNVDGMFGVRTRNAVIEFQLRRGLESDGIVGPKTRALLMKGPGK